MSASIVSSKSEIGTRGYIYSDPVNIYATDSIAPTITKTEISNDGSKLILTFNENISWSSGDAFSNLLVTVNGSTTNPVTAVNTSNTELQATLSDKILSGQQITLDYSNSSQTIQDLSGNSLSSIISQSVTNISNVIGFVNGQPYEGDFHTCLLYTSPSPRD